MKKLMWRLQRFINWVEAKVTGKPPVHIPTPDEYVGWWKR